MPLTVHILFLVYAGVLGASVGSFMNVCVSRLPHGESLVRPRSKCPACGGPIAWYDNVPLLSWILLRGNCRQCREPISIQYPAIELVTAAIWVGMAMHYGPTWRSLQSTLR